MSWLFTILREIVSLFVDDAGFAAAILAWLLLAGMALPRLGLAAGGEGFIVFAGLAVILVASAARRARR